MGMLVLGLQRLAAPRMPGRACKLSSPAAVRKLGQVTILPVDAEGMGRYQLLKSWRHFSSSVRFGKCSGSRGQSFGSWWPVNCMRSKVQDASAFVEHRACSHKPVSMDLCHTLELCSARPSIHRWPWPYAYIQIYSSAPGRDGRDITAHMHAQPRPAWNGAARQIHWQTTVRSSACRLPSRRRPSASASCVLH